MPGALGGPRHYQKETKGWARKTGCGRSRFGACGSSGGSPLRNKTKAPVCRFQTVLVLIVGRKPPNAERQTVNALRFPNRLSGLEIGLISGEGNFPYVDDFCLVGPLDHDFLRISSFEIT
jgi:hypothetical protein